MPTLQDPRRAVITTYPIDKAQYYTDVAVDMGEIAADIAMVKEPDRRSLLMKSAAPATNIV